MEPPRHLRLTWRAVVGFVYLMALAVGLGVVGFWLWVTGGDQTQASDAITVE